MTAEKVQPAAIPAAKVLHPRWCDAGKDCQGDIEAYCSVEHIGEHTSWLTNTSDTRLHLELTRDDDHDGGSQVSSATRVRLTIRDTGSLHHEGCPIIAATHLDEAEIDVLVRFLEQYKAKLAWEHRFGIHDYTADKLDQ